KAFAHTAAYDAAIRDELPRRFAAAGLSRVDPGAAGPDPGGGTAPDPGPFPSRLTLDLILARTLRYGENPHQRGALYAEPGAAPESVDAARQIQGKGLSFNNIMDMDSA